MAQYVTRSDSEEGEVEVILYFSDEEMSGQTSSSRKEKRGRERPPTKGTHMGIGKARKEMAEAKKRETQLRARNEILESELKKRAVRDRLERATQRGVDNFRKDSEEGRKVTRKMLLKQARDSADTIVRLAQKSDNLKGTYVSLFKSSAGTLLDSVEGLNAFSSLEESLELRRENGALIEKMKKMEEEMARMRAEMESLRRQVERPILELTPAPKAMERIYPPSERGGSRKKGLRSLLSPKGKRAKAAEGEREDEGDKHRSGKDRKLFPSPRKGGK